MEAKIDLFWLILDKSLEYSLFPSWEKKRELEELKTKIKEQTKK